MPRFLTPGRVCLLVLIDLYLAEEVASSVRVDLLAFVASRIHSTAGQENVDIVEVLKHMSGDASTFSYVMSKWPSGVSGRTTYDAFLQRLWSFSGLDTLHIFFDHLSRLIASPASNEAHGKLSRASPIGQYVRRCCIEFTRLQFADFQELWQSLVRYRASTQEFWAQKNPEGARRLEVVQSQSMIPAPPIKISRNEASTQPNASAEDVDMILTLSVQHLQKLGTRLSDEMKSKLQQWIWSHLDSGVQSLQHFLSFFEHWKAGQYTMALENLHRYFDYSLNTKPGTENMRVYYQYALLHLSVLHADFDCWEESVEAMNECIATARENHDVACLNFALSWLLCLCQAKPAILKAPFSNISGLTGNGPGEQDEIAFLKAKAKETRHWSLLSGTSLEEAKLELCHVGFSCKTILSI
ncbi:hypothetical protein M433DRAFT_64178 [Acidomyces richmondensis BFW]|nr:MAG: hypothetical protein FE78DRAFT_69330 [Acidomyces sp. 'richmondensis']KYG46909.1 hypothetical protein M433DRAFT_64178 [Acidomyces richmondensis BFW]